ncbi:MAG TPA: hypothetical protein VGO80_03175 [Solirubrobacteraceae bacterium]|jgi:hypothetical protein|nr:hypothetical protein [Solirubrobacteraceae bacterium]
MGPSPTTARSRRRRKRGRAKIMAALPAAGALRTLSGKRPPGRPLAAVARPSWKLLGLAGMAGVAATGVVVARNRRAQRDVAPDELRERLHERLAAIDAEQAQPRADAPP